MYVVAAGTSNCYARGGFASRTLCAARHSGADYLNANQLIAVINRLSALGSIDSTIVTGIYSVTALRRAAGRHRIAPRGITKYICFIKR